jgi:hypothetical protein
MSPIPLTSPEREAAYYVDLIGRLLASGNYDWARDTLEGISSNVCFNNRITRAQKAAIDHVMAGRLRHDLGGSGGPLT